MKILENVSLKPFHTFGIEVKTKYFVELTDWADIEKVLAFKKEQHLPLLVLGGGSNLLFTQDFEGLILKVSWKGIKNLKEDEDNVHLEVAAGEVWQDFVEYAITNNWAGVENLSLIPGTVGAAPMQNIGAYGVEIKEVISFVEAYHLDSGKIERFANESCHFAYRESIFKHSHKNQYIITKVGFKLSKKPVLNFSYGDIQQFLTKENIQPSVSTISRAVIAIRQSKLPNPAEIGNAGSFFKNPYITKRAYELLKEKYPTIPFYPISEVLGKVPAGWLIEQAGWKGYRIGDTGVHQKQALVLVNYGNAKGTEIKELSEKIKTSVQEKFGISLETEVNII
ncbi:MAG: UDP-N-acetylmuramate dehydrogenase [Thermonemataceae bacterium]|nr:UDP-N-acetylmuramate dehydrogenase [Thermonemataceae bacterium]